MKDAVYSRLAETISKHETDILKEWVNNQRAEGTLSEPRNVLKLSPQAFNHI